MSLLISDAAGSREVAAAVNKRPGHPEVILLSMAEMPFGDCMMTWKGPQGKALLVGVEIKKLDDILSCIQTGRFAGWQMPGMLGTYDISLLLVEGNWQMNHQTGVLEHLKGAGGWHAVSTGPRKWMYRELNRWLLVLSMVAGIQVLKTRGMDETVQTLIDLHALGEEGWNDHRSLKTHSQVTTDQLKYRELPDGSKRMRYEKPSLLEKLAAQFDGLGVDRAIAVGEHFKSVKEMINAGEKEWAAIPGVGKKLSGRIVKTIAGRGEKE